MKDSLESQTTGRYETGRLNALTDGIFAIAMTILVLDLNVSEFGNQVTSAGLWQAIVNMHQDFTSFFISFLLLGSMWAVHMRQFEFIKFTNRRLTAINTFRLLVVVIVPLATSISGTYQDLVLGRMLLPLNFLLLAVVSYWEWTYAASNSRELHKPISEDIRYHSTLRNRAILLLSLLTVIGSIWLGYAAFLVFLLSSPLTKLLEKTYPAQKA